MYVVFYSTVTEINIADLFFTGTSFICETCFQCTFLVVGNFLLNRDYTSHSPDRIRLLGSFVPLCVCSVLTL